MTKPGNQGPPGVTAEQFFGSGTSFGNGRLWVGGLGDDGVIRTSAEPDGSFSNKFGWWRAVEGQLSITGRRLDATTTGPAVGHVPQGYGAQGFQSSGVTFPAEGCWQVTGSLDTGTSLTFVTFVTAS